MQTGDSLIELLKECLESSSTPKWELLIRRVQPVIASSVWRTLARAGIPPQENRALIDDLVQQTFLRMCASQFRALRRLEGSTDLGLLAYLRTSGAHVAIDYLRRRHPPAAELDETLQQQGLAEESTNAVLLASIDSRLRHCSEESFHRDRRVFWLYYRAGVTAKAIAELPGVNLSVKGVESLILRLTRCIRKLFAETLHSGGIPP